MGQEKLICKKQRVHSSELVICDSKEAFFAHKELFRFEPGTYHICEDIPFDCISTVDSKYHKIHFAATWEGMLIIALWRSPVSIDDVIYILKDLGMTDSDLRPFHNGGIEDIFPVLYYSKHFDIFRKVCNLAKRTAEFHLKEKNIRIDCHLASVDSNTIVASSL